MSTRCTTHFVYATACDDPVAIIYRHHDGYPEGAGRDILRFLDLCAELPDTRFGDPSYLAAKYVVFLADRFNTRLHINPDGTCTKTKNASPLDFSSVGIIANDYDDIDYRYVVTCDARNDSRPKVECFEIDHKGKPHKRSIPLDDAE